MMSVKKILVPTDFEPSSERALALALTLAARYDAGVTIVHVWEVPPLAFSGRLYSVREVLGPLRNEAQQALDQAVARAARSYPDVTGMLRAGDPKREILDAIAELGPDLVVMGTHGRTWLARVVLGSIAERVVRASPVPVLTVHASPEASGHDAAAPAA